MSIVIQVNQWLTTVPRHINVPRDVVKGTVDNYPINWSENFFYYF